MLRIYRDFSIVIVCLTLSGCSTSSEPTEAKSLQSPAGLAESPTAQAESSGHPEEGPHHGSLVELGDEAYHAEVVRNADAVTIYILDAAAQAAVPIKSGELTINLLHEGKPYQYKLAALPMETESAGMASRFSSTDEELKKHLDHKDSNPKLIVTINETQYRGDMQAAHDHDGHTH